MVCLIPRGKVATYGEVARAAGYPAGARQVAWALKHADLRFPWHRVIGDKGRVLLRGENGMEQVQRLEVEGVEVRGTNVDLKRFGHFQPASAAACNLDAIPAAKRRRYRRLLEAVRDAMRSHRRLRDGLALDLDTGMLPFAQVAEWLQMERLCCPFLTIDLRSEPGDSVWHLRLRGPAGTAKAIQAALAPTAD